MRGTGCGYFYITSSPFFNSETQEGAGQKKLLGKTEVCQTKSLRPIKNSSERLSSTNSPR